MPVAGGCEGRCASARRGEFVLSMACFLGVALLGVIQGIFIAVGLAFLGFIWRGVAASRRGDGPRRWAQGLS